MYISSLNPTTYGPLDLVLTQADYATTPDDAYGVQHYPDGNGETDDPEQEIYQVWQQNIEPEGSALLEVVGSVEDAVAVINLHRVNPNYMQEIVKRIKLSLGNISQ